MKNFINTLKNFWKDEDGSSFLETAIIIVIVAILAVAVFALFDKVNDKLSQAGDQIDAITLPQSNP